ncbi:DUF6702 family protein [Gemmatimonas phototrophica]|uniref:Uncharacterized protein n=1 Tax=Gemmatimonas phototrophica TaxID=1379270 RepID=A0A143BHI4_9BACT|nr:DUF6702 family protein [Gemmatimonas phototrophica]AMW04489.1 hypothetical protein GEMMAAP_05800 [Gemmatimonas phototrophica]
MRLPMLLLACALTLPSQWAGERGHPIHVSSTQIDVSRDRRSLEMTVRVFTDDLEAALKAAGMPVSVAQSPDVAVDSALSRYIGARLLVAANGAAPRRGSIVGHEREDDATLVHLELPVPAPLTSVQITQPVLLELFEDQTNLLHMTSGTVKRSGLLRRGTERVTFQF